MRRYIHCVARARVCIAVLDVAFVPPPCTLSHSRPIQDANETCYHVAMLVPSEPTLPHSAAESEDSRVEPSALVQRLLPSIVAHTCATPAVSEVRASPRWRHMLLAASLMFILRRRY